jgi:uncharacterized protein YdaU (DUF1376 family)
MVCKWLIMHYYKRNLGDYAKKAGRLSMLQHGSYTLLIDSCYDREQFPTLEEAIEWTWASTTEEIEAVKFVLSKFFTLENGVYVQKRIQEEIGEYITKAETNKRIALERETKRKENATNRSQVVNEPPPNHKPITNNQEPITKEESKKLTSSAEANDPCPQQAIIEIYHSALPMMPAVREWTPARAAKLRSRWKEKSERQTLDWWAGFFAYVAESDFLCGRSAKPFTCNLEWLITPANFAKVVEGNYENRGVAA